ncbi:porin [Flavihumibacter stibioxidans]|nr:porin [Flavihumibacter stibioxidans]
MKRLIILIFFSASFLIATPVKAQLLMDMVDTTKEMGKDMLGLYQKFNYLRISGYMQPQFQVISEKGAPTYAGPSFPEKVDNRFTLRRGRIRFDYARFNQHDEVSFQFAFQFDGTERGVNIRDFWGRVFENKWHIFSFTSGMFARPFGYEVNLSSSDRESPERGRMSQILMKTERDLGVMMTIEPRNRNNRLKWLKIDAGVFNGQGLSGPSEYDSYKDFIARAGFKPLKIATGIRMSAAVSYLNGGLQQNSRYLYNMVEKNGLSYFEADSNAANIGNKAPRKYYGADMQWTFTHPKSKTILRAEYWRGTQTAQANTTETPGTLTADPLYIRKFDGAYFYLLHAIGKHQLAVKYDWYDPNTRVSGKEIQKLTGNFHVADVRHDTWGFGYLHYLNDNLKFVLWYDLVRNETTALDGYTSDKKDNVLTARLQYRF